MIKILIIEDEEYIAKLIEITLSDAGYFCLTAKDGNEAVLKIDKENPDLILLDIMLPEIDGYELLEYIKPLDIPTIMITAKSETLDKVKGLQSGADDYITKPFEVVELLARVEALLRRLSKLDNKIKVDNVEIDLISRTVLQNGDPIAFTKKEYDLLLLLAQNKNTALFKEKIFEKIWGFDFIGDTRTLDLHISRIRQKLGWQDKIKSIKRYGYRLEL